MATSMSMSMELYDGPIIDSHVHFWDPTTTPRKVSLLVKWLGWNPTLLHWVARFVFPQSAFDFFASPQYMIRPYLPVDYQNDCKSEIHHHHVTGVVHVQAGWEGPAEDETKWLESLMRNNNDNDNQNDSPPPIVALVAEVDLSAGADSVRLLLQKHQAASSRVRGVRDMLDYHPQLMPMKQDACAERSRTTAFREGLAHVVAAVGDLTFETNCYSHQLGEMAELAKAFPHLKILVEHVGTPIGMGGPGFINFGQTAEDRERILEEWKASLTNLAQFRNIYLKLSGMAMPVVGFGYEKRSEPPSVNELVDELGPMLDFCIDTFGTERCMFGSNFPIDKVSVPLDQLWTALKRAVQNRSISDQAMLFHGTAETFYNLNR